MSAIPFTAKLTEIAYRDGDVERRMQVPKGDVLHRFRQDVAEGRLPTVSWLVAPKAFSDHPSSAWYGSWYISEVLDILTQQSGGLEEDGLHPDLRRERRLLRPRPAVRRTASPPARDRTGHKRDRRRRRIRRVGTGSKAAPAGQARESSIGLGYRVPMIIASPWSRGGCVCSQVFDHTSVLQFLEKFLTHKTGKKVEEPNISRWRRTVCGDLTSAFQSFQ